MINRVKNLINLIISKFTTRLITFKYEDVLYKVIVSKKLDIDDYCKGEGYFLNVKDTLIFVRLYNNASSSVYKFNYYFSNNDIIELMEKCIKNPDIYYVNWKRLKEFGIKIPEAKEIKY